MCGVNGLGEDPPVVECRRVMSDGLLEGLLLKLFMVLRSSELGRTLL